MCTKSELHIVLEIVKDRSEQLFGQILDRIILYGSYARGDYTDESDIDIMIILDCSAIEVRKMREAAAEMSSDISLEQEVFLSILLRDKKHYDDNMDFLPFYRNVSKEGVAIYG